MTEEKRYYDDQEEGWCAWCGETLPLFRHWRTKFCGKQCGNAYFNSLVAEARAAARADLTCRGCGQSLQSAKRRDVRYCSEECRKRSDQRSAFICNETSPIWDVDARAAVAPPMVDEHSDQKLISPDLDASGSLQR